MIWKQTTILLSLALYVLGDGHHAISEQRIKIHHGHHGDLSHVGNHKPEHHDKYASSYPSYEFSYKVHDPHTHDIKGQKESKDGDKIKGEYWLVEPDGRTRTVTYHADKHSGFHATVHYSDDHHHIQHHHEDHHHENHHHEDHHHEDHHHEDHHHEDHHHEEHHDPEPKKEEENNEEGAGGNEDKGGAEEGGKTEGENQEAAPEGEEEEARGAEETRDREQEVGRWVHDRFWGHRDDSKHGDRRSHHDRHDYHDDYYLIRGVGGHKREEEHKAGLGSYGRRHGKERAQWHGHDDWRGRGEGREETRPEVYKYDQGQMLKTGSVVRENYIHPRFYRHSRSGRKA